MNIQQLIDKHERTLSNLKKDLEGADEDTMDAVDATVYEEVISREKSFLEELRGLLEPDESDLFNADDVVGVLEDCDHLDDAKMWFNTQGKD